MSCPPNFIVTAVDVPIDRSRIFAEFFIPVKRFCKALIPFSPGRPQKKLAITREFLNFPVCLLYFMDQCARLVPQRRMGFAANGLQFIVSQQVRGCPWATTAKVCS
jgi:hypothetical protein